MAAGAVYLSSIFDNVEWNSAESGHDAARVTLCAKMVHRYLELGYSVEQELRSCHNKYASEQQKMVANHAIPSFAALWGHQP